MNTNPVLSGKQKFFIYKYQELMSLKSLSWNSKDRISFEFWQGV